MFLNSELFGHFRGTTTIGYLRVKKNDLILSAQNLHLGNANVNLRFEHGIISPAYKVYDLNNCNPEFVQSWVKRDDTKNFFLAATTEGASQCRKNIEWETLGKQTISMPSLDEQNRVGSFFKQLDNLITLHQRQPFLHSPPDISLIVQLTPPFYTFSWEQRKVTEIGKIYIGLVTTMTKHYTDEGTLLIRNSDIKDGKFEFGDNPIYLEKTFAEKNETRMHQIGDVITVHTGDVGTSAVITENEAKSIGFATIVTRPNPKIIDSNYLCSFLNTDKHKKWAVSISTGDGRTNYNLGDYFELVVPVPSIAEQKKIASYIQKLNRLITLHQRQTIVYAVIRSIRKVFLAERQYFAPPMVRKSP